LRDETPVKPKPAWPLFVLAALSLIPGLGVILGAVAATWGLVASRPRGLLAAALGAGGAMLQIVALIVWATVFQANSAPVTQAMIQPIQRDLAALVGSLDRYHARTGNYPATLFDLQQSGLTTRFVNIYDEAGGVFHFPRPYRYSVAPDGRSFDLFSAGPDRRPGTEDDIRPVLPDSIRLRSGYRPSR
jgi:hypothetical protein